MLPPSAKTLRFWEACTAGDLAACRELLYYPGVDLNWKDPEWSRSPFYRACYFGHVAVVRLLMTHPDIDINGVNKCLGTPLYVACQNGHTKVVKLLLADPRTLVNPSTTDGSYPLFIACEKGHVKVLRLLLAHPQAELNKASNTNTTPLWMAAQNGQLEVVQLLLGADKDVDAMLKRTANDRSAAQQARWAADKGKWDWETAEDEARRRRDCLKIALLIEEYERNKAAVKARMRRLNDLTEHHISEIFALIVYTADGYLRIPEKPQSKKKDATRFFRITSKLPVELQMVISNRLFGSSKDFVLSKYSEQAFRSYAATMV